MSGPLPAEAARIVSFWRDAGRDRWFNKDEGFDRELAGLFADLHQRAKAGGCDGWAETPDGALALILLLDQFSRNIFRGSAEAFALDHRARQIATEAINRGFDTQVDPAMRAFFYLPFMHSESILDQERCVALCHPLPDRGTLPYAREHERIIRRFGRFPHRNPILGRYSSPAEEAFLAAGGFAG